MNSKSHDVPRAIDSLSPRGGAKHRMLKTRILKLLQAAEYKGLSSEEIAEKLDVLKHRIQGWFYSTGKHEPHVQKVGINRWRYRERL